MTLRNKVLHTHTTVDEEQARQLRTNRTDLYPVQVHPPRHGVPETVERTVRGILEFQTKWFGTRNKSPRAAFEIHRTNPKTVSLQYVLPTKRLDRKLRTQLKTEIPDISFSEGTTKIPVSEEETLGGGLITTGRKDWYPLRTNFDHPPQNSVVSLLHRHAMRDTQFVIQILFRPVIGNPVRNWWWIRRAYKRIGYLRKEKEKLWGNRPPTPREKNQADAIEQKAGSPRFHVSIRFLIIGANEFTPSRVKELAGGFNIYENLDTGQYLNATTIQGIRKQPFTHHAKSIKERQFNRTPRFQATLQELSALISLPEPRQENITTAEP